MKPDTISIITIMMPKSSSNLRTSPHDSQKRAATSKRLTQPGRGSALPSVMELGNPSGLLDPLAALEARCEKRIIESIANCSSTERSVQIVMGVQTYYS
jgi:hypothetical protein